MKNCLDLSHSGHFTGGQIDRGEVGGRDVRQEFRFVSGVKLWDRHVEVRVGNSFS